MTLLPVGETGIGEKIDREKDEEEKGDDKGRGRIKDPWL